MLLVFLAQTAQYILRFGFCGLVDCDRLKTTLKRRILFYMRAVFRDSGCADDLELSPRKGGLYYVCRINSTLSRTRAYDHMKLVYKEDYIGVLIYFLHNVFHTFLKLSAVFSSRYHSRKVKRDYSLVQKIFGYVSGVYPLCESFHHSGLAHARLTYQAGIVLHTSGENPYRVFGFSVSADYRIKLSFRGICAEIPCVER